MGEGRRPNVVVGRTRGRLAKKVAGVAGRSVGKAFLGGGKAPTKPTRRVLDPPEEPAGARYAGYGLVVLGGFAIGVLVGLRRKRGDAQPSSTNTTQANDVTASDPVGAQGRRDEELGSASPAEDAGGDGGEGSTRGEPEAGGSETEEAAPPAPPSEPPPQEDPPDRADVAARRAGIEGLIRSSIEEDPRTSGIELLGIEVDDGMVTVEGSAPSAEAKQALTQVVGDVEGVNIVVNRVRVGSP